MHGCNRDYTIDGANAFTVVRFQVGKHVMTTRLSRNNILSGQAPYAAFGKYLPICHKPGVDKVRPPEHFCCPRTLGHPEFYVHVRNSGAKISVRK